MRRNVFLSLCLMILTLHGYAADGVVQDINRICNFTFPKAPQRTDVPGLTNYLYQTDTCSYLVQVKPLTKKGVVTDTASLYAFYGGIVKGILRGYHATLIGEKRLSLNNRRGYEVEYVRPNEIHKPVSVCSRLVMIGDQLVIYTFTAPYSLWMGLRSAKDTFFASFSAYGDGPASAATSTVPSALPDTTATPIFDSVSARLEHRPVHTELVRPNTVHFIISFAVCIILLAAIMYARVR